MIDLFSNLIFHDPVELTWIFQNSFAIVNEISVHCLKKNLKFLGMAASDC